MLNLRPRPRWLRQPGTFWPAVGALFRQDVGTAFVQGGPPQFLSGADTRAAIPPAPHERAAANANPAPADNPSADGLNGAKFQL